MMPMTGGVPGGGPGAVVSIVVLRFPRRPPSAPIVKQLAERGATDETVRRRGGGASQAPIGLSRRARAARRGGRIGGLTKPEVIDAGPLAAAGGGETGIGETFEHRATRGGIGGELAIEGEGLRSEPAIDGTPGRHHRHHRPLNEADAAAASVAEQGVGEGGGGDGGGDAGEGIMAADGPQHVVEIGSVGLRPVVKGKSAGRRTGGDAGQPTGGDQCIERCRQQAARGAAARIVAQAPLGREDLAVRTRLLRRDRRQAADCRRPRLPGAGLGGKDGAAVGGDRKGVPARRREGGRLFGRGAGRALVLGGRSLGVLRGPMADTTFSSRAGCGYRLRSPINSTYRYNST